MLWVKFHLAQSLNHEYLALNIKLSNVNYNEIAHYNSTSINKIDDDKLVSAGEFALYNDSTRSRDFLEISRTF